MSLYPHQVKAGDALADLVRAKGVGFLMGEPRTGKTRSALYAVDLLACKRGLFITKKMAIQGILDEVHAVQPRAKWTVTNFEQVAKESPDDFDIVVVDEAHNIGTVGKPSLRFKTVRKVTWGKPLILLSGTPNVETPLALYYQFALSKWSPLPFKTFYDCFRAHGVPSPMFLHGRQIEQYKKAKPTLLPLLQPYFVTLTQADAGLTSGAVDVVHRFDLEPSTVDLIRTIRSDQIALGHAFETDPAVRTAVHQVEAGAVLLDNRIAILPNTEMADYIRATWGDRPDVAVMCHFRSTREKLSKMLGNVALFSSDGHAEGVRLDRYQHFVIANTGYSGSKHIQRRERATLMGMTQDRQVHHLMARGQLSEQVYKAVSQKRDFNIRQFRAFKP